MIYPAPVTPDSRTRLYGIFGNPVRHSLSPAMHNAAFSAYGVNAVYVAFEIPRESLSLAFIAARTLGIGGVNVTVPFKEEAAGLVDDIPEDVDRRIGAVNTVVNREGKFHGYNTDGPGFMASLAEDLGFHAGGKKILMLGAGGAARSVVVYLAKAGAAVIMIHDMIATRAEGLKDYLTGFFPETEFRVWDPKKSEERPGADLVVNATPCGMKPADPLPFRLESLTKQAAVLDLIYAPAETALLAEAKRLGFPCTNGLGMLSAQGALAFEIWTGKKEGVLAHMRGTLKKCLS